MKKFANFLKICVNLLKFYVNFLKDMPIMHDFATNKQDLCPTKC